MPKKETIWTVVDPSGHYYTDCSATEHDKAIINVLKLRLPAETFGTIHWSTSYRGTGALHYLWRAMCTHGWKTISTEKTN